LHRQGEGADEDSGHGRDHRLAMRISHEKLPSKPANEMDVRPPWRRRFEPYRRCTLTKPRRRCQAAGLSSDVSWTRSRQHCCRSLDALPMGPGVYRPSPHGRSYRKTPTRRMMMASRLVALIGGLALGGLAVAPHAQSVQPAAPRGQELRTPWGDPDLQGIWSGETLTPLQR